MTFPAIAYTHSPCWPTAYTDGYRAGYLDARQGIRLQLALHSPCQEYAEGYRRGQANTDALVR